MNDLEKVSLYKKYARELLSTKIDVDIDYGRNIRFWISLANEIEAHIINDSMYVERILKLCRTGK